MSYYKKVERGWGQATCDHRNVIRCHIGMKCEDCGVVVAFSQLRQNIPFDIPLSKQPESHAKNDRGHP